MMGAVGCAARRGRVHDCGPTAGLGEVRQRAPCYCAGFTVGLPELADRHAITIADAVDRARFDFAVHTELAGGTTRGEGSSIYSRSRP